MSRKVFFIHNILVRASDRCTHVLNTEKEANKSIFYPPVSFNISFLPPGRYQENKMRGYVKYKNGSAIKRKFLLIIENNELCVFLKLSLFEIVNGSDVV